VCHSRHHELGYHVTFNKQVERVADEMSFELTDPLPYRVPRNFAIHG
jgi:hypothetical protein